jgi:glycosyltransferase involved in cell wall biosynthesis
VASERAGRVAVYCDFPYRRHQGALYAEQAFASFLAGVSQALGEPAGSLVLIGRLDPEDRPWHFRLPESLRFAALPHYPSLGSPGRVAAALGRSIARFWRALDNVDTVWLFGPNPVAVAFALAALARRRHVALGVRQEYVAYVRNRHPGKRWLHLAAVLLDGAFRLLARRSSVVVVGPALAERYAKSRRLLAVSVALVAEREVVGDSEPLAHSCGDGVAVLSVGRLDNEKNPLLLADALAELCSQDGHRDWTLRVCGEGPLEEPLRERLRERGMQERAQLCGFVPAGPSLREIYRESDMFLHVSHTEGVPQVLFEAFAAGLPIVATDVGGVAATVGDAGLLVPPADPHAAADALSRLASDAQLRERLARAGLRIAREHTLERQCARVAEFLTDVRPIGGPAD